MFILAIALAVGIITLPVAYSLSSYAEEMDFDITVAEFETGKLADAISDAANGTDYNFITKIAVLSGTISAEDWNALTAIPNLEYIELAGTDTENGEIPDNALPSRNQLTYISLPKNTVKIGANAFSGNRKLQKISMPSSVSEIGDSAFESCEALAEIPITENVTYIGESAFRDCKSITEFTIPSGITEILSYTFSKCGFSEIIIPPSVASIGDGAFSDCGNLTDIYVYSENAPTLSGSGVFQNVSATIHVYEGSDFSAWENGNLKTAEDLSGEYPTPEEAPAETDTEETISLNELASNDAMASSDDIEADIADDAEDSEVIEETIVASSGSLSVGVTVVIVVMAVIIAVLSTILVMSRKKK